MTQFAGEATVLNIQRYFEDDYPVEYTVPLDSIAGFSFELVIDGICTIAGTITDADAGEVEFDPANALDLASAVYDATELDVGVYSYYVVMTDTASDERTIVRGTWRVSPRAP